MLGQPLFLCLSVLNSELRHIHGRTDVPRNIMRHNRGNRQVQKMKNAHEWRQTASDQVTHFNQVGNKIKISICPRIHFCQVHSSFKAAGGFTEEPMVASDDWQAEGPHSELSSELEGERNTPNISKRTSPVAATR